jgi:sec-independent protein translocase protein TatC
MPIPKSDNGEMPFLDHLEELRWRIIYSACAFLVGLTIGLVVSFKFDVIGLLEAPALPFMGGHKLIVTHPADIFSIDIQIAMFIGVVIAAPVILYQLWAFLAPALHAHEKKIVIPILGAGAALFLMGVSLSWFIVLPMTLKWFYGLVGTSVQTLYSANEYISFVTDLALAFGVAFELPMVLVALVAFGILSAKRLASMRRWAILIIWTAAAVISPGDAVTVTFSLAIPLYVLYEVSVIVGYVIERKRRIKREADDHDLAAAT